MTKMPTQFKYQKQVWALGSFSVLLVCAYLFFVGATVYNTLERQRAEKQIAQITSDLGEMEFSYLNLKAKVNYELARTMGFVDVSSVVVAKSSGNTTAYRGNN